MRVGDGVAVAVEVGRGVAEKVGRAVGDAGIVVGRGVGDTLAHATRNPMPSTVITKRANR